MKNIFSKLLLLLLFTSFSLFASPTHPPLIKQGESYDDIANFTIGGGHSFAVNSVAFSPDGKYIVSGSWDKSVKLWSVEERRLVYSFEGHSSSVRSVAFSPDSKYIVSGSDDKSVKLWSVEERRLVYSFEGHSATVSSVAFSPDSKYIVSGSYDKSVKLWSVEERRLIFTYEGHSSAVSSVAFSPDSKYIVSGSWDKSVKLWSVEERRLVFTYEGHSVYVRSVAFSPDSKYIVSGSGDINSNDNSVKLWSVEERRLIFTYEGHSSDVSSVAFSPDGKYIVSGSYDKSVKLWSVEERRLVYSFEGHSSDVSSVAFSPDSKYIVSGSDDSSVKLWSVEERRLVFTYEGHNSAVRSVAFSPDSKYIVSGSWDKSVKLWSVEERRLVYSFEGHSSSVSSVAFSPDGKYIVSGSYDKSVKLWSVEERRLVYSFEGHSRIVRSVAFSPDSKYIVSGSYDKSVKLWSVEERRLVYSFEGHSGVVRSVAFSPDSKYIVSGSGDINSIDNSVKLWSVEERRLIFTFEGHSDAVNSVAFSPDSKYIVSGFYDKSVKLWSVEERRLVYSFEGHSDAVNSVAFSPDGKYIVSGSYDKSVKLWSVEERRLVYSFEGHSDAVNSVAFSPDGKYIVSGSRDNSVKLWSVEDKNLFADIYSIGANWVWFDDVNKTLLRVDDGSLLWDQNSSQSKIPKNSTSKDDLDIKIPKEIDIYSQKQSTIEANITNLDKNISYWIKATSSDEDILLYPNQIIKLDPKKSQTLDFNISSSLPTEDRKPFSKDINITFITANGVYETKKIKVNFKTPKIEIKKAKYTPKNKTLVVDIINSGSEAIGDLKIKIGEDTQEIKAIEANSTISKSFVLTEKPKDIKARVYKDFYEWNLSSKVSVESMLALYIILAILIVVLFVAIYYYRRYRHPLIIKLEKQDNLLSSLRLDELAQIKELLNKIDRFEDTLKINGIPQERFDRVVAFESSSDREAILIDIFGSKTIVLRDKIPLNIDKIEIEIESDTIKKSNDITLALSNREETQESFATLARDKRNNIVAPSYQQLSKLLLSKDITKELLELFANNLDFRDISPYKIAGDVKNSDMFFGRVDIIKKIINRNLSNYIIVGARQLGKSSLLRELDRRYKLKGITSYYITLDKESDLVFHLSKALGVDRAIESVQEAIYNSSEPIVFLIDEIDELFLRYKDDTSQFSSLFRSLSQGDKAYFIFAGFWEIYQDTLKAKSPLRNFGEIIRLGGLEKEACRELITKPMQMLGIEYADESIIEEIIYKSGTRTNLMPLICHRLISAIENKQITQEHLNQVLAQGLGDYIGMSLYEEKIDRVVIFATISKESFYIDDIFATLDRYEMSVESTKIEESLNRLELSFVIYQTNGVYRYQVPLFVEMIQSEYRDIEAQLEREIRGIYN